MARPDFTLTTVAVFLDLAARLTTIAAGQRHVPIYEFPESAVEALAAAARYCVWRDMPAGQQLNLELNREALDGTPANALPRLVFYRDPPH